MPGFTPGRYRATSAENSDEYEFRIDENGWVHGVGSMTMTGRRVSQDVSGGSAHGSSLLLRVRVPPERRRQEPPRVGSTYFQVVRATTHELQALMATDSLRYMTSEGMRADRYTITRDTERDDRQ